MTKLACRVRCCLLLALLCRLASAAPHAPEPAAAAESPRASAAQAFERGKQLWAKLKLAEALAEFERAYQLSPEYAVLYYIGAVNMQLEQWARARRAFESFLELGDGKLSPEQVKEVRVHLAELNKHTAKLTLTLNVPGAEVQVDGDTVESTTISGLILDTGEHVVRVSKPGFQPLEQVVQAADGQDVHLVLPLAPLAPVPDASPAGVRVPAGKSASAVVAGRDAGTPPPAQERLPLWVPWTITGALATGWAATAALAIQARHDRDLIERPGTSAARIDAARRLHITLAVVSDVLLASALASAGVSAYLTWSGPPADPGLQAPEGSSSPSGLSLKVAGRF